MIDTIKLAIPLSKYQHKKLVKPFLLAGDYQWTLYNPTTGDVLFTRCRGLAQLDQASFHREIFFDLQETYRKDDTYLFIELSLPKFWYGHNILLIYDFITPIQELKKILEKQLRCKFTDIFNWKVLRLDLCYAWRCPNQSIAESLLESLKKLHFPYKKPTIYESGILFKGATYSFKFYLKQPEFFNHDRKILIKSKCNLEWINHLEKMSEGIIRCEALLRYKYLKRNNILTVKNLCKNNVQCLFGQDLIENHSHIINKFNNDEIQKQLLDAIMNIAYLHFLEQREIDISPLKIHNKSDLKSVDLDEIFNKDNNSFYVRPSCSLLTSECLEFLGGTLSYHKEKILISILKSMLTKFIGENKSMNDSQFIKNKLLETYQRAKAMKLVSFWLYVQQFGSSDAKESYGKDSYYRCKRDLKKAGISLIEPPILTIVDDEFIKNFRFDIPSSFVSNQFDEYRNQSNILNLDPYRHRKENS